MENTKDALKELEQSINSMTNRFVELNNAVQAGRITSVPKTELLNWKQQLEADQREVFQELKELKDLVQEAKKDPEPGESTNGDYNFYLSLLILVVISILFVITDKKTMRQQEKLDEVAQQVRFLAQVKESEQGSSQTSRYPAIPKQKQPEGTKQKQLSISK